MRLYLLGICHWDPLGRDRLIQALRALQKLHNTEPPYFVAVEYNRQQFDEIRVQRPLFRNELSTKDPGLSAEELNVFELALAYEGDAHQDVFPNCKTVWLVEGESLGDEYYKSVIEHKYGPFGNKLADNLANLSHYLRSQKDEIDNPERDKNFMKVVESKLNQEREWAIVIVGRAHTNLTIQESMANLLKSAKVQFIVKDLTA